MVGDPVDFVGVDVVEILDLEEVLAELVVMDLFEFVEDVVLVLEEFLQVVGGQDLLHGLS